MYNHVLRGLIINSGLTQKEFAKILGISDATLSNIIAGKTKCRKKEIIADYFNVPVRRIFKEARK